MPRAPRIDVGGYIYHVINRANARAKIFQTDEDYRMFEALLIEAKEQYNMNILAYVIMPNHWHLLLYPKRDGDVGHFMHWLTTTHATRYHSQKKTIGGGHVYQGRYKSFLVDTDQYVLTVLKYIERNPARANLVTKPELWRWGSAYRRVHGTKVARALLGELPVALPHGYLRWINQAEHTEDLTTVRNSVNKGVPYGSDMLRDELATGLRNKKL